MGQERLDKLLAATGRWSRREAKTLIREGRVLVGGRPALLPEGKADPEEEEILVDGTPLNWERYTYLMLNKPAGVVSATDDRRQKTVLDLLPPELQRRGLFPVGRLDRDTEGLLLLTNNGPLAHRLLAPRRHVDKRYYVELDGPVDKDDAAAFAAGMMLGGESCLPALLEPGEQPGQAFVTLHEGKFHQIKRMFFSRGRTVLYLKRMSMGPLTLDPQLQPGEFRNLFEEERQDLEKIMRE